MIEHSPNAGRLDWASRLFEDADSDEVQLLALEVLHRTRYRRLGPLLRSHLEAIAESPAESTFVHALADVGVRSFEPEFVANRFDGALSKSREHWLPWLRLTSNWPQRRRAHLEPLCTVLARLAAPDAAPDEIALRIALRGLARTRLPREQTACSTVSLKPWLAHPSVAVQADASRALGRVRVGRQPSAFWEGA